MLTRITTDEGGVIDVTGAIVETVELNDDGTPVVVPIESEQRLDAVEARQATLEADLAAARQDATDARADAAAARAEAAAAVQRQARELVVDPDLPETVAVVV